MSTQVIEFMKIPSISTGHSELPEYESVMRKLEAMRAMATCRGED